MPVMQAPARAAKTDAASHVAPETACMVGVHAKLISLNGGIVLSVSLLFSALAAGAALSQRATAVETAVFSLLALAAWTYLCDAMTERLELRSGAIERTSLLGRRMHIRLDDLKELLLVHEGLNQNIGIESLTARYRNGSVERLPLGPCWRRRDLEGFLASVEDARGDRKLLEEVR